MNAVPNSFWDVFVQMTPADRAPVLAVFGVFGTLLAIVIAVVISKTVYRIHRSKLEDALKRELVDRGFSPEEIVRIVESTASPQGLRLKFQRCQTPKEPNHVHAS